MNGIDTETAKTLPLMPLTREFGRKLRFEGVPSSPKIARILGQKCN
jgi:hypothetical protein